MEIVLMILEALPGFILVFFIWPITLGAGLGVKKNLDRYLIGFVSVQALFFIVYIPAILFAWSSRTLTYTAALIITVISIGGFLWRYKNCSSRSVFLTLSRPNYEYLKNPWFLLALVIILYELWIYIAKEPYIYGDDVTYITLVTRFVDTNAIYTKDWVGQVEPTPLRGISYKYVFTSYYPYLGMISILTKLHPLILCKTLIPLVYLPTHYLITWRIGDYLFSDEKDDSAKIEKQSLFLLFYAVLIEFGHISYYTMSRRVTIWIYNSKSDCFTLLIPILFFYAYLFVSNNTEAKSIIGTRTLLYRQSLVLIMALACNSSTLMGVIMSSIIMGIWYFLVSFRQRTPLLFVSCLWTLIPHIITVLCIIRFAGFTIA